MLIFIIISSGSFFNPILCGQILRQVADLLGPCIGVDVSKGKSMVSVLRPFGEVVTKPFSVGHTGSELKKLADYKKGPPQN